MRGLALLLLVGCGMTEARFERKGWKRWCQQANNCDPGVDVDTCIETLRSTERTDCVYDPVAAETCFDALVSVTCIDLGLDVRVIDVPESCEQTWVCGEEP